MRIIYVDSSRIPTEKAHGIQIMKMCEAFGSAGAQVELVIPRRHNPLAGAPFDYYQVKKIFRITRLPTLDLLNIVPKWGLRLQSSIFFLLARIYLLFRGRPDVLYLREKLAGKFFRSFVMEVHTLPKDFDAASMKVWKKARKLLVTTSYLKRKLVEWGAPEEKILVAPDGVDLAKFAIRQELKLPPHKKTIMYTGNFFPWKGVFTLAEASKKFGNDYLFVFIGGSPYEQEKFKRQLTRDRGLVVQNIKLIDHVRHNLIPSYLAAADVLVLPNSGKSEISRFYTSPLKLFEYMAAGKPIVASDLPSIREVLSEANAVLVEPDNPTALAEGISKVLTDQALADKVTKQARQDVQEYDWNIRAQKILNFISTSPILRTPSGHPKNREAMLGETPTSPGLGRDGERSDRRL